MHPIVPVYISLFINGQLLAVRYFRLSIQFYYKPTSMLFIFIKQTFQRYSKCNSNNFIPSIRDLSIK